MTDRSAREVLTGECKLAFPSLFEPRAVTEGSDPKYQAVVLIPPGTDMKPFHAAMKAAMEDKFGKVLKLPARNNPIKDCEEKAGVDGYEPGWSFINVRSGLQPGVVDHMVQPIRKQEDIYAGCLCRFHLTAYGWDHPTGGKGVSFSLNAVQKVGEGERLDGRRSATDLFEPVDGLESPNETDGDGSTVDELFA